jgi:hypothetical protein
MTKNQLEILFGSRTRWRLIKFFLLNERKELIAKEVAERNKLNLSDTQSVLKQLAGIRFILTRSKRGRRVYFLNKNFPFHYELKKLVIRSNTDPQCDSLEKMKKLGSVKLGIISGAFLNHPKSKTDLLIVGENISKTKMKNLLENLEAELGREINYSLMNLTEFNYRVNMFDKFILEIMEGPHEIVVNKIPKQIDELKSIKKKSS